MSQIRDGASARDLISVVVAGDSGCGKSSLLERIAHDTFSAATRSTVSVDIVVKSVRLADGRRARIRFFDLVGQDIAQPYQATPFYKGAEVVLAVFDCKRPETFDSLCRWKQRLAMDLGPGFCFVVVCNKADLLMLSEFETISEKYSAESATRLNADAFITVSAKTGLRCETLVSDFVKEILSRRPASDSRHEIVDLAAAASTRRGSSRLGAPPACAKC